MIINRHLCQIMSGMLLKDILQKLENFAPLSLAADWDNVGLLVDPLIKKPINKILLTNDLTEDIVQEAVDTKSNLIITYHPNIFKGLKTISNRTWKERIIIECIKNEIVVFSPHTSWDSIDGGVNDWLANAFNYIKLKPIKENPINPNQGMGRLLTLKKNTPLKILIEKIKLHIKISHLRLALGKNQTMDSEITDIALCAGSGNSILQGITADLYLTGEMLHHDILDATQNGISVILCNHSDSERGFLRQFQNKLQNDILGGVVNVSVSKFDADPLITV